MAANNYNINYEDERFKNVESEKTTAINDLNNTYDQMIGASDKYYQDQINAAKDYSKTQQEIQQANTDFAIDQINQQKDQAQKDYTKEQAGAYVDWQKQSDQYGTNAEQQAAQGLTNTGYSESSQVSMYNTYQNRVATARESYTKAVLNYDNAIKDAQLQNNSKLAEIAYNALQTQLELSLQGFQYKNQLILEQINKKQELDNTYYARYQDVLNQMNQENALAEQIRQYNESYQLQLKQFDEQVRQFNQESTLKQQQFTESIRQFNVEIERLKKKDAQEYALEIKKLEQQKKQIEIQQKQWESEMKLKQQQFAEEKRQFDKAYSTQKSSVSSSSGSKSSGSNSVKSSTKQIKTNYYSGAINPDTQYGTFGTKDKNGVQYQPDNIGGTKLKSSGKTVAQITGNKNFKNSSGVAVGNQTVWKIGSQYYIWNGSKNKYEKLSAK